MITRDDIEALHGQWLADIQRRYDFEVAIKHENEKLRERIDALLKIVDDNAEEIARLWASLNSVPPSRR